MKNPKLPRSKFEQMIRLLKQRKELTSQMIEELLIENGNPFQNHLNNGTCKIWFMAMVAEIDPSKNQKPTIIGQLL
ncbi:MAG: hypothetical protein R2788_08960 [Saprospiraceae bacterium]